MELDFSNEFIERLLLKKSLGDVNWVKIMEQLFDRRWFSDANVGSAFVILLKYREKYGETPNIPTLKKLAEKHSEKLDITMSEFNEMLDETMKNDMNIPDDAINSNLKEYIRMNACKFAIGDNINLISDGKFNENYAEVVDRCIQNFDRVQNITFNDSDLGMNYFNPDDMKKHWDYILNPESRINTKWKGFDKYTYGGVLRNGHMLAVFMGQAGLGKSLFLSNISVNFLKQGLGVVVISLEMSNDIYAQRFDAHISKQNINMLKYESEDAISKIKEFYKEHPTANLYIKEYPPRSIKTGDIKIYLENLRNAGYKFDVVVIDYLNLVLPNKKEDNMYQAVLTVSEELRAMSFDFKVPFISATQCNGEGMNNENIDMQHVSESKGICHTVDFLGGLYQTQEMREEGSINMRILKNRLGGHVGNILKYHMDKNNLTLDDITLDDNTESFATESDEISTTIRSVTGVISDINDIE